MVGAKSIPYLHSKLSRSEPAYISLCETGLFWWSKYVSYMCITWHLLSLTIKSAICLLHLKHLSRRTIFCTYHLSLTQSALTGWSTPMYSLLVHTDILKKTKTKRKTKNPNSLSHLCLNIKHPQVSWNLLWMHGSSLIFLHWPSWLLSSQTVALLAYCPSFFSHITHIGLVFCVIFYLLLLDTSTNTWLLASLFCSALSCPAIKFVPFMGQGGDGKQLEARSCDFCIWGFIFKLDIAHSKCVHLLPKEGLGGFWPTMTCERLAGLAAINVSPVGPTWCLWFFQQRRVSLYNLVFFEYVKALWEGARIHPLTQEKSEAVGRC